ncbi:MAG TPA: hypothetical protein VHK27_00900 [Gammaproteobacteria bacterium]|nr:hypothetical protein [Gammaproteobacteria bacterium]
MTTLIVALLGTRSQPDVRHFLHDIVRKCFQISRINTHDARSIPGSIYFKLVIHVFVNNQLICYARAAYSSGILDRINIPDTRAAILDLVSKSNRQGF